MFVSLYPLFICPRIINNFTKSRICHFTGRPPNQDQYDNFMKRCNSLEKEGDMHSVSELYEQIISLAPSNTELRSLHQYLKRKLQ